MAARTAATSGAGPQAQPIFQPVKENVLPADEIESVRSLMPGQGGQGQVGALEDQVLVDLVGHGEQVVARCTGRAMAPSSSAPKTLPVGLCGELRRMRRVRGPMAAASSAGSKRPVRRAQAHRRGDGAGHGDAGGVGVVGRLEGDDLVARLAQGEQGRGDGLGGADRDEHLVLGD